MAAAPQPSSPSAAAGAEQRSVLFTSGVLPVLLQHPAVSSDCKAVCRLLTSSSALRSAVLQHASGMADLQFGRPGVQQLCWWLSSHGQLLRSIKLTLELALADSAHLVYALRAAAAATPGGLQLQELQADLPMAMAGLVLQPLPTNHLTQLCLTVDDTDEQVDCCLQLAARALAGLTNLSELALYWSDSMSTAPSMDAVVPALSGLSRLTNLDLIGCTMGKLALLPQQLVELVLRDVAPQPPGQLQLGHLTALTRFQYSSCHSTYSGWVQAGDVLPPNLLRMAVDDCSATEPVAVLTRLTRLELTQATHMPPARLVRGIAGLHQLQQLEVIVEEEFADEGVTAAWPAAVLPALVELSIHGLRSSKLVGAADTISRLSALTCLCLVTYGEQDVAAIDALARDIAGLPRLQELSLCGVMLGRSPVAAELLSAATGLTSLRLQSAGLDDHLFSQLFATDGLTKLRSLDLAFNPTVSAPCALLVARGLPHLTELRGPRVDGSSDADARCRQRIESLLQQRRQAAGQ